MGNGSSIQCPVLWKPTEQYVRWTDEHEKIMLNKKELTSAMSGGFRSWIQSWKGFTVCRRSNTTTLLLTTQNTQVDVQQNPEIYAHRIRENLDRDCAHVHAILIRGETTVRSVLRNRFYIPRLHTTRTGYQICTEKGS